MQVPDGVHEFATATRDRVVITFDRRAFALQVCVSGSVGRAPGRCPPVGEECQNGESISDVFSAYGLVTVLCALSDRNAAVVK